MREDGEGDKNRRGIGVRRYTHHVQLVNIRLSISYNFKGHKHMYMHACTRTHVHTHTQAHTNITVSRQSSCTYCTPLILPASSYCVCSSKVEALAPRSGAQEEDKCLLIL